ncbi:HD domain-containing protein, partial [Acinetobacter baumannii]
AMAEDLRIVLLKLAERLQALRNIRTLTEDQQTALGREVMTLYAPLANRLGLGQLKWEMEDLAFRATSPLRYQQIAKELAMKRSERESLVKM